jgi:hypothetical protein
VLGIDSLLSLPGDMSMSFKHDWGDTFPRKALAVAAYKMACSLHVQGPFRTPTIIFRSKQ